MVNQKYGYPHLSLFNLMNSSSVVVTSLDSLLNHTETINGQYQMATIKKTNFQNMLDFFSKRSGIKEKQLLAQHSFKQHTISIAFNLSLVLLPCFRSFRLYLVFFLFMIKISWLAFKNYWAIQVFGLSGHMRSITGWLCLRLFP